MHKRGHFGGDFGGPPWAQSSGVTRRISTMFSIHIRDEMRHGISVTYESLPMRQHAPYGAAVA